MPSVRLTPPVLHPLSSERDAFEHHCLLGCHRGTGHFGDHSGADPLAVHLVVPANGVCVITLAGDPRHTPAGGIGRGLRFKGESDEDGPFEAACPQFSVGGWSGPAESPGWATASPVNEAMAISYGPSRPIARVQAQVSNFDFEYANVPGTELPDARGVVRKRLRVRASGRNVEFAWRADRAALRRLVDAGVLPTASFVSFSFAAWPEATEAELIDFAREVGEFCTYAAQQHTGVPVVALLDADGRPVKRLVGVAVQSHVRRDGPLDGLLYTNRVVRLFERGFDEHLRMNRPASPWRQLPSRFASVDDPPYLEQKFAALMMALEYLMKNSILESPASPPVAQVEEMDLSKSVNYCKGPLRWNIPKHYTASGLHRMLRNAVMHGGKLPTADDAEFRAAYDKWRLFFARRVYMRLGYDGSLTCEGSGRRATSAVDDFSEEHNTFA